MHSVSLAYTKPDDTFRYIPIIIVAFGLVTTLTAFVKNFGGFLAVRIALGISEGGLMLVHW